MLKMRRLHLHRAFPIIVLITIYMVNAFFLLRPFLQPPKPNHIHVSQAQQKHLIEQITTDILTHKYTYATASVETSARHVKLSITQNPLFKAQSKNIYSTENIIHTITVQKPTQASFNIGSAWFNYQSILNTIPYWRFLMFFVSSLLLLFLIASFSWLASLFSLSLTTVGQSIDKLTDNIHSSLYSYKRIPIIGELITLLINMQKRIQTLITRRTQLLSSISHDMRTPLTRLKLQAHLFKDQHARQFVERQVEEMEQMIDGLLSFAGEDVLKEKSSIFLITDLVTTLCWEFNDMDKDVTPSDQLINLHINFHGAYLSLKRCFMNVINNGLKYGKQVYVDALVTDQEIQFIFTDQGPGIPESEHKNVFKPFYRTAAGKASNSTGSGLGLSIVKEIIEYHKGTIQLKNPQEGGLQVIIHLPLNHQFQF